MEPFTNGFLGYDMLARRRARHAHTYRWLEAGVGVPMGTGVLPWLSAPVALVIGAVSVAKAVFVERRDLKCAGVGDVANVSLGFISLSENVAMTGMIGMGLWMALAALGAVPTLLLGRLSCRHAHLFSVPHDPAHGTCHDPNP